MGEKYDIFLFWFIFKNSWSGSLKYAKKKRKHSIICIKVLLEGFIDTYTVNAQGKKQWGQDRALMCSFMLEYTQT